MSFFEVIGVILKNLIGYDLIILLLAVGNALVYVETGRRADALYKKFNISVHMPSHAAHPQKIADVIEILSKDEYAKLRVDAEKWYGLFTSITSIFPLLGILGTVLSLLPMVSQMSNFQGNFFEALTSTFWGLVFAIVFKFLDGFLSTKMEDNDKNVSLILALKLEGDKEERREEIRPVPIPNVKESGKVTAVEIIDTDDMDDGLDEEDFI